MSWKYRYGRYHEERIVRLLNKHGYTAVRIAKSGYNTPDIVVIKDSMPIILEVKTSKKDVRIWISKERLLQQLEFCSRQRVLLMICYKFPDTNYRVVAPWRLIDHGSRSKFMWIVKDKMIYSEKLLKWLEWLTVERYKDLISKQLDFLSKLRSSLSIQQTSTDHSSTSSTNDSTSST